MKSLLLFECTACERRFEAEGKLEAWTSSLYGPCCEYTASCPECHQSAKEYRAKPSKSGADSSAEACARADSCAAACSGADSPGGCGL